MTPLAELGRSELQALREKLLSRYTAFQEKNLALDMTRGKPSPEQLNLAMEILTGDIGRAYRSPGGVDCRNYGGLDGIRDKTEVNVKVKSLLLYFVVSHSRVLWVLQGRTSCPQCSRHQNSHIPI